MRDKLEALYQADLASNSQSQIQKEGNDLLKALMKANEARFPRAEEAAECVEKESTLEWSLDEKDLEYDSSLSFSNAGSKLEESNISVSVSF